MQHNTTQHNTNTQIAYTKHCILKGGFSMLQYHHFTGEFCCTTAEPTEEHKDFFGLVFLILQEDICCCLIAMQSTMPQYEFLLCFSLFTYVYLIVTWEQIRSCNEKPQTIPCSWKWYEKLLLPHAGLSQCLFFKPEDKAQPAHVPNWHQELADKLLWVRPHWLWGIRLWGRDTVWFVSLLKKRTYMHTAQ